MYGIIGEKGSGKTYLSHLWQQRSQATRVNQAMLQDRSYFDLPTNSFVLDDIDASIEANRLLFEFINHVISTKKYLLVTSSKPLNTIDFKLADLQSRLNSIFTVKMHTPNEEGMAQVLVKLFSDRQIVVDGAVVSYLINRLDRSYAAIIKAVDELDKYSLAHKRKISVPLVKEMCSNMSVTACHQHN
jgi:chromosomal replication initiation ATPase DnaA